MLYDDVLTLYQSCISSVIDEPQGELSIEYCDYKFAMAQTYELMGQFNHALDNYARAYYLRVNALRGGHVDSLTTLNKVAHMHFKCEDFAKALEVYMEFDNKRKEY